MPDFSASTVGRVNAMAEAWKNYADAVDRAVDSFQSVESAFKRKDEQEEKELARKKKLIEAQQKAGILTEEQAAAQLLDAEETAKAGGLARRDQKVSDLVASSRKKMAEAEGIKVSSPEDEARIEEQLKKRSEFGAERRSGLQDDIAEMNTVLGGGTHPLLAGKMYMKYGVTTDEGLADQRDRSRAFLAGDDAATQKYRAFVGGKPDRARLRERKSRLASEAGAEVGAAAAEFGGLYSEGGAVDQFRADSASGRQIQGINLQGALAGAERKQKGDETAVARAIASHSGLSEEMINQMKANKKDVDDLRKQVRELAGRAPRTQ
jgi:hypothetical protein